jgi:hypothetical protein
MFSPSHIGNGENSYILNLLAELFCEGEIYGNNFLLTKILMVESYSFCKMKIKNVDILAGVFGNLAVLLIAFRR